MSHEFEPVASEADQVARQALTVRLIEVCEADENSDNQITALVMALTRLMWRRPKAGRLHDLSNLFGLVATVFAGDADKPVTGLGIRLAMVMAGHPRKEAATALLTSLSAVLLTAEPTVRPDLFAWAVDGLRRAESLGRSCDV